LLREKRESLGRIRLRILNGEPLATHRGVYGYVAEQSVCQGIEMNHVMAVVKIGSVEVCRGGLTKLVL